MKELLSTIASVPTIRWPVPVADVRYRCLTGWPAHEKSVASKSFGGKADVQLRARHV